mgnify:CR=1 FL=1
MSNPEPKRQPEGIPAGGQFAPDTRTKSDVTLPPAGADTAALLDGFVSSNPKLDIWRRYPDISEDEDDATDEWACAEVSGEFAEYAQSQGWEAEVVEAVSEHPMADEHVWVHLHRGGQVTAVDWTARQYHNLEEISRDPKVMGAPWPLTWDPRETPDEHPLMGGFSR